ncbi:MAG TPA: tetratricopeptide repeat protein [Myxococcales bacterium]|jgi:Flp pilus assembly protein TadD
MGKVIKLESGKALDEGMRDRMRRFVENELTWAEVEGMTAELAGKISRIGCELAAAGRLNDARIIFEGLVAGNPKDHAALSALGTVYAKLQRKPEAIDCFDKALALFDRNVVALSNRGELRLRGGDTGGLVDLAKAVEVDSRGMSAAGRRARTLLTALAKAKNMQPQPARKVAAVR